MDTNSQNTVGEILDESPAPVMQVMINAAGLAERFCIRGSMDNLPVNVQLNAFDVLAGAVRTSHPVTDTNTDVTII